MEKMKRNKAIRTMLTLMLLIMATSVGLCAHADENRPKSAPSSKLALSPAEKRITIDSNSASSAFTIQPTIDGDAARGISGTWRSSNTKVAKVNAQGKVTPVGSGTAIIRYSTNISGSKRTSQCRVSVKVVKPTSVALSAPRTSVSVGSSFSLNILVQPQNAYNKSLVFKSSNKAVATVSSRGVVKAKKPGKVTIYAKPKAGGKEGSVKLQVTPNLATGKFRLFGVGQSNYSGDSKLPGCRKDVEMIASAYKNASFSGAKADVNAYFNLTGAKLRALLSDMSSMGIKSSDTTIFYYSGHGIAGGSKSGALCGVDWDLVTVDEVRRYLDRVPGKVVVMLDSCLSGQFISSKGGTIIIGSDAILPPDAAYAFGSAFIGAFEQAANAKALTDSAYKSKYKIITAAAPKQSCYISNDREDGCSVFSDYAAQALGEDFARGKVALGADASQDGIVTLTELFTYVDKHVKAYVNRHRAYNQTTMVWPKGDKTPIMARN